MTKTTPPSNIEFAALPAIGTELAGGTFAGVTTEDGVHCAVVLLPATTEDVTHKQALAWAKKQGGVLPSRPVAALLFANLRASLKRRVHWTCEADEDDASYAWYCHFSDGYQGCTRNGAKLCTVAVRLIPLAA